MEEIRLCGTIIRKVFILSNLVIDISRRKLALPTMLKGQEVLINHQNKLRLPFGTLKLQRK